MDFTNYRLWFEKKGSCRFISHLDLTRVVARALKLSGLPVWYTEGFNPRIYMTYGMPLSLGVTGLHEILEIRLVEDVPFDTIIERLNDRLPADIRILEAALPVKKLEEIAWADYTVTLTGPDPQGQLDRLEALLAQPEIRVMKHGKKGDKEIDIKPDFAAMGRELAPDGTLRLTMRLPCSVNGSVNPSLLLDALGEDAAQAGIVRTELLGEDQQPLR